MMEDNHIPPFLSDWLDKTLGWISAILLISITGATIAAICSEYYAVYLAGKVALTDILLLFIYLEVLAMVHQYVTYGKLPVRYPIYIAIIAIARYIILGMKEMDSSEIIWLSIAVMILTISTTIMRIGHNYWPYNKMPGQE
jgi:protein PsiE